MDTPQHGVRLGQSNLGTLDQVKPVHDRADVQTIGRAVGARLGDAREM